jgi:AcrR family transcriptional regulator
LTSNRPRKSAAVRKLPTQARARETIDLIFEATAQIVEDEGEARLTTNKIASKAGFSIGTIYQYFPDKDAILLALINTERRRVLDELRVLLEAAVQEQQDVSHVVRIMIHLLVESFGTGSRYRRAIVRIAWHMDHLEAITQALREAAEANAYALEKLRGPSLRTPTPAMMFVVTRAVMGAIRSASLEESLLLGTPEFEDELVNLVMGAIKSAEY